MAIEITDHFKDRFHQRVANTKRMPIFVNRAFKFGKHSSDIKYSAFADEISNRETLYGATARIYSNNVYWFVGNRAITIYPVPQNLHGRL